MAGRAAPCAAAREHVALLCVQHCMQNDKKLWSAHQCSTQTSTKNTVKMIFIFQAVPSSTASGAHLVQRQDLAAERDDRGVGNALDSKVEGVEEEAAGRVAHAERAAEQHLPQPRRIMHPHFHDLLVTSNHTLLCMPPKP